MDYRQQIENVKSKLMNHNWNFTSNDIFLIKKIPELKSICLEIYNSNDELFEYLDPYEQNMLTDEDILYLNDNFFVTLFKNSLKKGVIINTEALKNAVADETYQIIKQELRNYLKSVSIDKINNDYYFSNEEIMMLIDLKRFDILSKLTDDRNKFSPSEIEYIMSNFPFDKYDFPAFTNSSVTDNFYIAEDYSVFEKMPLSMLFKILHEQSLDDENEKKLINLIDYKLENENWLFDDDNKVYKDYLALKSEDKLIKLGNMALQKGYVTLALSLLHIESLQTKEYISKLANLIANYPEKIEYVGKIISPIITHNDELLNALVKNGSITKLNILDYSIKPRLQEKLIPLVLNEINNNNPNYRDITILSFSIFENEQIFEALINHNYFDVINDSYEFCIDLHKNEKLLAKIYDVVVNGSFVPNRFSWKLYSDLYDFNNNFLNDLLKNGKYDLILNVLFSLNFNDPDKVIIKDDFIDNLANYLNNNYEFANKLFNESPSFVFKYPKLLQNYVISNSFFVDTIMDYLEQHDDNQKIFNKENFIIFKSYFASKYNLNEQHLDILASKFGYKIIRYLSYKNIHEVINLSDENFTKLMDLLEVSEFTIRDAEMFYDALKQFAFSKENPSIVAIFNDIIHSIEDKNDTYVNLLAKITPYLNEKFKKKFVQKYPKYSHITNYPEFLHLIISNIQNNIEKDKNVDILHFITQYYIAENREVYRSKTDMYEELNLPFNYDEKDYESKLADQLLRFRIDKYNDDEINMAFRDKLLKQGLSETLIYDCVDYYKTGIIPENKDSELIRKNIKNLILCLKEIYATVLTEEDLENAKYFIENNKEKPIKKKYYIPNSGFDMYSLLLNLNLDLIKNNILSKNKVYESLNETLKKYKLLSIPDVFKTLLEQPSININFDRVNIGSFMTFYEEIYKLEKKRLQTNGKDSEKIILSIPSILMNAEIYSSASNVYSQILGKEDANLIKLNPSPNSASKLTNGEKRLQKAVELTIKNFKRQKISIPTFNEVIQINENKRLRVVVGNFTHPCNLTHGERTGACMRIGGAGESLFNFAIDNENGFHIRFEDPDTGEYISRVSGFRNGNTIFLNELRNSCNLDKYTNDDIIKVCQKACEKILAMSKESPTPIQNALVAEAYATEDATLPNYSIEDKNIKEGLPNFYSDIGEIQKSFILASDADKGQIVPFDFDKSNIPTYLPARENIVMGKSTSELYALINRVFAIKKILQGENYAFIASYPLDSDIVYGFANQDWFVFVDQNGEIHSEIIDIDERAKIEYNNALIEVNKYVEEMKRESEEIKYAI